MGAAHVHLSAAVNLHPLRGIIGEKRVVSLVMMMVVVAAMVTMMTVAGKLGFKGVAHMYVRTRGLKRVRRVFVGTFKYTLDPTRTVSLFRPFPL